MRSPKCSWERFLKSRNGILDPRDMISRMPENVLHHVVSFLPDSEQHRYKFLSRKWRLLDAQNRLALSLTGRRLNEEELSKILIDDFHSTEFLSLKRCYGIKTMKLMSYKMKNLELMYCGGLKNLDLNTPHLETFRFHGPRLSPCKIEFGICKQLKRVQLVGVNINNMMFMDCNKIFPLLKILIISCCDIMGHINISSTSLEKLSIWRFKKSTEFTIDTPNLVEFNYSGSTIVAFSIMNCPRLLSAEIELNTSRYQKRDDMWFRGLLEMIKHLKHTDKFKIRSNSDKNVIIPERIRETTLVPPLDGIKELVLDMDSRSNNMTELADSMLWIAPRVRDLDIFTLSGNALLKITHGETSMMDDNPCSFCVSYPSRCWRHLVKEIELEASEQETMKKLVPYLRENLKEGGNNGAEEIIVEL